MAANSYFLAPDLAAKVASFQRSDGTNTVEVQKVVVDEPFAASYTICTTAAISAGTANSHLIGIMAGASLRVLLRRFLVTQLAGAGAATQAQMEARRLTSAGTGGTAITPGVMDPADAASGCTAMSLPTVKGTEGGLIHIAGRPYLATVPVAGQAPIIDYIWDGDRTKAIVIAAGTSNGLALKQVTAVASATVLIYAEVVELAYSA